MVVVLVVDVFSSLSFSLTSNVIVVVVVVFHSLLNIAEAAAAAEKVGVLKSANIT